MPSRSKRVGIVARSAVLGGMCASLALVSACRSCASSRAAPEELDGPARRVVALAPNVAEIIGDIGGGEQLVGISSYGAAPLKTKEIQRVGGFTDPSIERIIELRPDLVIGVPLQARALESCRDAGLRTLEIDCRTVDQVLEAYGTLGRVLGHRTEAFRVSRELRRRLDAVRRRAEGRPRPRTLFLLGLAGEDLQQIFPVGPGNFGHELLELAGGQNVLDREIPSINTEAVITLAPEVIIEVAMDEAAAPQHRLPPSPFWSRLPSVPAVRSERVYALRDSSLLVPGPRMADGAELLERLLSER